MINNLSALNSYNNSTTQLGRLAPINLKPTTSIRETQGVGFADMLKNAISNVEGLEKESARMGKLLASGKIDNLHDVVIAGQKASIAVELTVQVRNKAVEAYQEVMRMQV